MPGATSWNIEVWPPPSDDSRTWISFSQNFVRISRAFKEFGLKLVMRSYSFWHELTLFMAEPQASSTAVAAHENPTVGGEESRVKLLHPNDN